ncbi:NAD-dependent epimerase/dehydratase family protein [Sneathiella chinensis]|uniref:NAD-dependent epimerase n=1 Tax=Sneathiella chinensis TaxID=349750 RepID=A0ABQ5U5C1_9PROT|nr:NAD-dependent epimerase/dehydratase family protein [Sneathiella chinensis]GLQ06507.1 NAD-dependent epimerase [Sneathiella chinensis]
MTILVTGAAGFIGMHVSQALLAMGQSVVGLDNMNSYYDPALKEARLERLQRFENFSFVRASVADEAALAEALAPFGDITHVIHLAAQAGVRYSIDHPLNYVDDNMRGFLNILEYCRHNDLLEHLIYASSSSVYGGNRELPYSVSQSVDRPVSLYAASKKANELMAHSYSHLYRIPATGLRFFTVYGPWGRPDMAYWLFVDAMLKGDPIRIFNHGDMRRDFTYIDDIVWAIVRLVDKAPEDGGAEKPPYALYNIGNNRPEQLLEMVHILEDLLGLEAEKVLLPMQPGDVKETFADIEPLRQAIGFEPQTDLRTGLGRFVEWYKSYKKE